MPLAAKSKAWHYPLKFTSSEQQSQLLVLPSPDNTPHASSSPFTSSVALSWMLLGTLASPYSTAHDIQGETLPFWQPFCWLMLSLLSPASPRPLLLICSPVSCLSFVPVHYSVPGAEPSIHSCCFMQLLIVQSSDLFRSFCIFSLQIVNTTSQSTVISKLAKDAISSYHLMPSFGIKGKH